MGWPFKPIVSLSPVLLWTANWDLKKNDQLQFGTFQPTRKENDTCRNKRIPPEIDANALNKCRTISSRAFYEDASSVPRLFWWLSSKSCTLLSSSLKTRHNSTSSGKWFYTLRQFWKISRAKTEMSAKNFKRNNWMVMYNTRRIIAFSESPTLAWLNSMGTGANRTQLRSVRQTGHR